MAQGAEAAPPTASQFRLDNAKRCPCEYCGTRVCDRCFQYECLNKCDFCKEWFCLRCFHLDLIPTEEEDNSNFPAICIRCAKKLRLPINPRPAHMAPRQEVKMMFVCPATKGKLLTTGNQADSGDGTLANVGIRVQAQIQCLRCTQRFDTLAIRDLHATYVHNGPWRGII